MKCPLKLLAGRKTAKPKTMQKVEHNLLKSVFLGVVLFFGRQRNWLRSEVLEYAGVSRPLPEIDTPLD